MINLNDAQKSAVTAADGPALVLAGAGSGKTRVIIERLAWLVRERGVDPRHLLALTFTNRAAGEMKERFAACIGAERTAAWIGTFHAFGLYLLRREMTHLRRSQTFTVFDDNDQLSLVKRLIQDLPSHLDKVSPRDALRWIGTYKQRCEIPKSSEDFFGEEAYLEIWSRYHASLERCGAVDFDDLLSLPVRLFQECPEVLEKYQRRYQHVLIDEYQDTNRAQYLLAERLTAAHRNIFAVGDEDQSIYAWRGADINNILDFSKDFPKAIVFRLEQNYRCTAPILDAANALVASNVKRLGKNLWTDRAGGEPVRLHIGDSGEEEASFIVEDMMKRKLDRGQVAVLVRTNAQTRLLEEALLAKGLRYVVVGGIKFYARKEIKDVLGFLRLVVNPADDEALRRVLNVPPRGIGATTQEHLEAYAAARGASLFDVLRDVESDETLSTRGRQAVAGFVHLIDELAFKAKTGPVVEVVEALLELTGYRAFLSHSDEKDSRSRIEIVDEFIASCRKFDTDKRGDLLVFLQDLALYSDTDELQPDQPAVTLMTCHSAKGLEFDHVYLAGMEEGLLPFGTEYEPIEDVEEERRLCYVAMTRARKELTLSLATSRMLYGRTRDDRAPSRFLREIGAARLLRLNASPALAPAKPHSPHSPHSPPTATAAPAGAKPALRVGVRVRHAKFGPGTVLYTSGDGEKLRARVRFNTGRSATLMVAQAPLEILEGKAK